MRPDKKAEKKPKKPAKPRKMRAQGLEHGIIDNLSSFLSALINYAFVIVGSITLYFAASYPIIHNLSSYQKAEVVVRDRDEKFHLYNHQGSDESLIADIKSFYFDYFPDEIRDYFDPNGEKSDYSMAHIFNVIVFGLPENPTPSNYQVNYFSYYLSEEGVPLVDTIGYVRYEDLNKRGKEAANSRIGDAHAKLLVFIRYFDQEFAVAETHIEDTQFIGRVVPYGVMLLVSFLILPLFFKNGTSLGERIFHIGYANKGNGYGVSYWKLPLKMVLYGAIAVGGIRLFLPHFFVLFCIFPYFLNAIYRLFSNLHRGLPEKFLFMVMVDLRSERLYKNQADFLQQQEIALETYSDPGYTGKLSSVETISLEDRGDGAH